MHKNFGSCRHPWRPITPDFDPVLVYVGLVLVYVGLVSSWCLEEAPLTVMGPLDVSKTEPASGFRAPGRIEGC